MRSRAPPPAYRVTLHPPDNVVYIDGASTGANRNETTDGICARGSRGCTARRRSATFLNEDFQRTSMELPTSALRLLVDILAELAVGNAVRVVPVHAELTTQEAADLLNVSRPHFIKLLETHALPYHRTGKHRRLRFDDLMKFKVKRDQATERAMGELAKQAQELKLGYE
jgi:excisionase family DNA binding protein